MYSNPRPFEEVKRILLNIISKNDSFVLASVKGNFNKDIVSHFKCAAYIEVPKQTRIKAEIYTKKKRHSLTLLNPKMKIR